MTHSIFKPSQEIRSIDMRHFIGKTYTYVVSTNDNSDDSHWLNLCREAHPYDWSEENMPWQKYVEHQVQGWTNGVKMGKAGDKVELTVKDAFLLQHKNGGRGHFRRYATYEEYFTTNKNKILTVKNAGLLGQISERGNWDRCDVCFEFQDGISIEGMACDVVAPEEWESERIPPHLLDFNEGYYENAELASEATSKNRNDDMFGERYFPIMVFPEDADVDKINEIMWRPKSHSIPIVKNGSIILGTRCKPHEFDEVISMTYELGGKVPVNRTWDW